MVTKYHLCVVRIFMNQTVHTCFDIFNGSDLILTTFHNKQRIRPAWMVETCSFKSNSTKGIWGKNVANLQNFLSIFGVFFNSVDLWLDQFVIFKPPFQIRASFSYNKDYYIDGRSDFFKNFIWRREKRPPKLQPGGGFFGTMIFYKLKKFTSRSI